MAAQFNTTDKFRVGGKMARSPSPAAGRMSVFAIRNSIPPGILYDHWHDVASVWPLQQGLGNAVKFTQGRGLQRPSVVDPDTETPEQLRVRAQAWADEPANPANADQVAAAWMTERGKFMKLVTGFICVSFVSLVVFVILQHGYDMFNCDYLFIGNVPFCNMMDDVRKMVRSNVDNLLYVMAAQILSVLYVALAFASTTFGMYN